MKIENKPYLTLPYLRLQVNLCVINGNFRQIPLNWIILNENSENGIQCKLFNFSYQFSDKKLI